MSEIKKIFNNVGWVTLSLIVVNICAFVWTISIARYLGVVEYGILSFAISFTVLLGMGTDIGMTTYSTREISADHSKTQKFINNIIPFKIVLSAILFVFTWVLLKLLGYNNLVIEVSLIMSFETILICMLNFIVGVFQANEMQKTNAIVGITTSFLLVFVTLAVIYFDLGLIFIALAYTFAYLFNMVSMYIALRRTFGVPKFEIDWPFWLETAKKSIPFGLSIFFYTIYFSIDVVMIQFLVGDYPTGIYNSAYKIVSVFVAFYSIYQAVIFPLMSKLYSEDTNLLKVSFEQSFKYSLLILLPVCIGVYLYSPFIINLIYTSEFALASVPMQILIWTVVFMFINGVATSLLNSIGKEISVTKSYIIAAVFNIVLNCILIPRYTYIGASISTVLSEILILAIMMYYISKTEYKPGSHLFKTVLKLIVSGLILFAVLKFLNLSLWLAIPIGLVVYILALLLTRSIDDTDRYIVKELLKR